jgi:hypothetical protein
VGYILVEVCNILYVTIFSLQIKRLFNVFCLSI